MISNGFADLADSPTIVLSPHQHQFDPISSRAAHTCLYRPYKPLMPTKPWDQSSKHRMFPFPTPTQSKKRSHSDTASAEDVASEHRPKFPQPSRTAFVDVPASSGLSTTAASLSQSQVPQLGPTAQTSASMGDSSSEPTAESSVTASERLRGELSGDSTSKRQRTSPTDEDLINVGYLPTTTPGNSPTRPSRETTYEKQLPSLLGVGWTGIGNDPDTQSAWRGTARAIETMTRLDDIRILGINNARSACFASADSGWYLVWIDSMIGHFLSHSIEEAFEKARLMLQLALHPEDSPPTAETQPSASEGDIVSSLLDGTARKLEGKGHDPVDDADNEMDVD